MTRLTAAARTPLAWIVLAAALAASTVTAWADVPPGMIAVTDFAAGTGGKGAVFLVHPVTGVRTLFSDFGNPAQGPLGADPYSIARAPSGLFYVLDQGAGTPCIDPSFGPCGALFSVNASGNRSQVTDFGNAGQGTKGVSPFAVAIDSGGQILVTDGSYPTGFGFINGALFRVDPGNGMRTALSDFTDANQGPLGQRPLGIGLAFGEAFVTDVLAPPRMFRVNLSNGSRSVVSTFDAPGQGPTGFVPIAVRHDPVTNKLLVVEQVGGSGRNGFGMLFSVDPVTGQRTVVSDFTVPSQGPLGGNPSDVVVLPDGQILVIDFDAGTNSFGAIWKVDRATGQRTVLSDFGDPAQGPLGNEPSGMALVPGTPPEVTTLVAAVLPASRSVQVGTAATAFVTIINTGAVTATGVDIGPLAGIPVGFTYQTTDAATNAVTGAPNTPAQIGPGGIQAFVISLTPTAPFAPVDVRFQYGGANSVPVTPLVGINTLLLTASSTPVPDVVALAATVNNDGIVTIPGVSATGAFSVATVNLGAGGPITVSADTGAAAVPVAIELCETNPATGACLSPPGATAETTINAGATPTFAVFVRATAPVALDPAYNRVFLRLKDAGNVVRGATSVAVRTE